MGKKLYKSNKNKMLDGVCGGIAEYFNIDPTLVRLGWVVFCALGGSGVLAYIVAALIIPRDPECCSEIKPKKGRAHCGTPLFANLPNAGDIFL